MIAPELRAINPVKATRRSQLNYFFNFLSSLGCSPFFLHSTMLREAARKGGTLRLVFSSLSRFFYLHFTGKSSTVHIND